MPEKLRIISLKIDHISFKESLEKVVEWGLAHKPSFVCFANAHMTIEAFKDSSFHNKLEGASLVLADGKPLSLACGLLYKKRQERIAGMDFMPRSLEAFNKAGGTVFFYGSTPEVLTVLKTKISSEYPQLHIGGAISPPFGIALTPQELQTHFDLINQSGSHVVYVALGCPKQEKWMADNCAKINAVLLGIGGALPVMAGVQTRAPKWMQDMSLEWLFRLVQEPRRMFKRYLYTNSYFIWLLTKAWFKKRHNETME